MAGSRGVDDDGSLWQEDAARRQRWRHLRSFPRYQVALRSPSASERKEIFMLLCRVAFVTVSRGSELLSAVGVDDAGGELSPSTWSKKKRG